MVFHMAGSLRLRYFALCCMFQVQAVSDFYFEPEFGSKLPDSSKIMASYK